MTVLKGKVAIVTGGGRGIGRATVELLAAHGAQVVVNDFDADAAHQAAAHLGSDVLPVPGDVTASDCADRLVEAAVSGFGGIDIVVNNAGYTWDGVIHKMSDEQFQAMLDIHTVAPFRLLRAAAPHMREAAKRERQEGREVFRKVVNVSSISGAMGNAGQANYSAAKAGLIGMTKSLAREWGGFKINVNAVAFGFVDTRLTAAKEEAGVLHRGGAEIQMGIPAAMRDMAAETIALGRPGTATEAAGGIFVLCTPWTDFVTGQVLNVTGGQVAGMSL